MPELLSPAGNREKLEAAIRYGADAVYLASDRFGMRAFADNFTLEQLKDAITYAHARGVKVYLTVNTMPREAEYPLLRAYFEALADIRPDALIVADIGVLMLAKEMLPTVELHLSTQANAISAASCRAWHAMGVKRIVLARELTLEEIKAIRENTPHTLELEAFIHGSMCVSYSGRCLLSGFFTGRDANRGACAQPCRWSYHVKSVTVTEDKRPDLPLTVEECKGESFVFSSKDTCMIRHIPELMESGIDSFKIEGRMKSAYYAAVVTNTYRMAMDAYAKGNYAFDERWQRELESVSHREYATGYYFADSREDANLTKIDGYIKEKAYLATVVGYDEASGEAEFVQKNKFCVGHSLELLTPGKTGIPLVAGALFDENHSPIESTPHPYMHFYMKMPFPVKIGDIIRSAQE
ncbi:MAG: U32 family peptidase [Ruminococcaceae bacterium]|nr:U32 family peptidase [Oscillospiraceae bacterium]